jgi:YD repeat-containing protein
MKPRITVLTLGVDDLERSLRFYRNGLDFEWNIRRGLAILNYGSVTPLFKIDTEGNPIGLSPAGSPDMRAAYDDFHLVIDVTVSMGATQYNMDTAGEVNAGRDRLSSRLDREAHAMEDDDAAPRAAWPCP